MIRASLVCLVFASLMLAQEPATVPLWPNGAPGAFGNDDSDKPTLTVFLPWEKSVSRTAVVVWSGGGYGLPAGHQGGRQVANWLNSLGIAAFVLKYRLG